MNYLWGAVNAISAPYQYYKELPPINPATLTGAIDVIVIRRSAAEGDTELACSPFHVRFGKWQVLRPAEKKVNVTVNGKPIPFNMKIGDAGEAFFVFETEGDVPDDLITSPVLQPTRPGQPEMPGGGGGRFGAKEDMEAAMHAHEEGATEPEFLDLNAPESLHETPKPFPRVESPEAEPSLPDKSTVTPEATQSDTDNEPNGELSLLGRTAGFGKAVVHAAMEQEREKTGQLQDRADATRNVVETMTNGVSEQFKYGTHPAVPADTGDEALPKVKEEDIQTPEILNNGDVVIDMSGYHSQPSKPSQHAEHDTSPRQCMTLPAPSSQPSSRASSRSRPTPAPLNIETSTPRLNVQAPSPIASLTKPSVPFPIIRAPSEPPPDSPRAVPPVLNHASTSTSTPEYSWEWGAFPQRSPYRAQFPKVTHADIAELSGESEGEGDDVFHRSKSLPPELDMETGIVSSPESLVRPPSQEEEERPHEMEKGEEELTSEGEQERAGEKPAEDAERKSWVRWWRRNSKARTQSVDERRRELKGEGERERKVSGHGERPLLQGHVSEPAETNAFRRSQTIAVPPVSGPAPPGVPPEAAVEEMPAPVPSKDGHRKKFAKTLRLTSDQLKSLDLQPGANTITFSLSTTGVVACTARIFVWDSTDHIVISDIDGTITKSDALGHVFTMIGRDWTHLGVAKLYTDICRNGYKIMYLTSRAIGQADSTRYYLQGIKQNDYQLPEGPVIMSPDRLMASLHREVIMRKPEVFKMACLRDIQRLFGPTNPNPFYAGFGNRITDALSYRSVNVPSSRIFTIDSNGEVKMELLELAGYKSPSVASYIHMTDLVDQMFPPIQHKWETEFTDNNYWKAPMLEFALPDLTPPSPALSARSDTSNQSAFARLRNFSLRSNTSSRSHTLSPPPAGTPRGRQMSEDRDPHLRQLSSLERLSNTLSGLTLSSSTPRRSLSPQSSATYSNSEEEEEDLEGGKRRRVRKRSLESMPGSLPGSRASFSEDEEEMQFGGEGGEDGYGHEALNEEAAEHAFDEDLFATGEMQNVPFL